MMPPCRKCLRLTAEREQERTARRLAEHRARLLEMENHRLRVLLVRLRLRTRPAAATSLTGEPTIALRPAHDG